MKKKNVQSPAVQQYLTSNARTDKIITPRNLTPALCDRLRRDLMDACRKVAEAHGLMVEGGELSDINLRHGFDIGFRVGIPMADGSLHSTEKAVFEEFGLNASDYGRIFKTNGEAFRITGINPHRPKYPISAERLADGRGYKFSVENIEIFLKAAEG